ncbi:MAG: arylesterase [Pseudomonadota bacterium]
MQRRMVKLRTLIVIGFLFLFTSAIAGAQTVNIVGFGDSLMAGYQLPAEDAFPTKLETALLERGYDVAVQNAGVSGDTTSGGLSRLDWSVPDGTDLVILELGGNDALRGIAPEISRDNLDQMIARLKDRGIDVILVGILAPPNMGEAYAANFNPIFPDLAEKHDVPLYPFFLDGAITVPGMMLADGIHPSAQGTTAMVERFMPLITNYLETHAAG